MILPTEVQDCISGCLLPVHERIAVDHYVLGGFHYRVLPAERAAFKLWFNARTTPDITTPPLGFQFSLIDMDPPRVKTNG